jgi:hypothetical protein
MNFYEQELRRIAKACGGIHDPVFAGRACYGNLGGDNRVKLQFVTNGSADHYDALKATVLNRTDGVIDTLMFRFADIWGRKQVSNPNFSNGIIPHIWTNDGKSDWYVYKPADTDIKQLAAEVGSYLDVFTDHSLIPKKLQEQTGEKDSVLGKIRGFKQTPPAPKDKPGDRKKQEPDL